MIIKTCQCGIEVDLNEDHIFCGGIYWHPKCHKMYELGWLGGSEYVDKQTVKQGDEI